MGMGPIICGNETFNSITASLCYFSKNGGYYVLRHAIIKNFPGVGSRPEKVAWKLYGMNLTSLARSYGSRGAKDLIKEKFAYRSMEPHSSLARLYKSILFLRQQCSEERVCASDLYKRLGSVLTAVAHEIAMEEAKKIDVEEATPESGGPEGRPDSGF